MSDAWVYAQDGELATELCRALAELGFSPRRVNANGSLLPSGDGSAVRRPALMLVAAATGEPCPTELVDRLSRHDELGDVPVVAAVGPEHVSEARSFGHAQELLVRPFAEGELELRIARARRLANGVEEDDVVRAGSLELNLATYQVTIAGRPISFAYMEYELLKFLITHPGRVFSREALLSAVWGYDYYGGARTVDVHVRRVRAKLGQEHAARIKTVRSVGYRFDL
jgi:DNA-binding response OmpR family regulator